MNGYKKRDGFTLVEILVVAIVIVVLATISAFAYTGYQGRSRDGARDEQAHIIANSLEKYYDKNGEYPSVAALVGQPGSIVQNKLSLPSASVLVFPGAAAGTTNSLTQSESSQSELAYNGDSSNPDEQDQCENSVTGGCDSFDLQWTSENGDTKEIQSNHQDRSTLGGQQAALPSAPNAPNISVDYVSPNVVATVDPVTCEAGSTPEYKILGATNTDGSDPNFSDWSTVSWQSGTTATMSATQGTYYYFKAIAHCVNSAGASDDSDESDIANYFYAATGTPVVTATITGTTVYVAIAPVTCPAGSTAKYQLYERKDTISATGSFAVVSTMNFGTTTNYTGTAGATSSPTKNWYKAYTRCDTSTTQGTVSPASAPVSVVSAPAAPTLTNTPAGTSGSADSVTWNWSLPATACPVGTVITYNRIWTGDYTNKGSGATGTATSVALTTSSQGYQYGMQVRASCGNPVTSQVLQSAYSANNTYIRNVDSVIWVFHGSVRIRRPDPSGHPNSIYGQGEITSSRNVVYQGGINADSTYWNQDYPPAGGCASGLTRQVQWNWDDAINADNSQYAGVVGAWSPWYNWANSTSMVFPSGSNLSDYSSKETDRDNGDSYEFMTQARCINASTGRAGPVKKSDNFGNLNVTSGTGDFHTNCDVNGVVPYCQGWHTNRGSGSHGDTSSHRGRNTLDTVTGACYDHTANTDNGGNCWTPVNGPNSTPWGW